MNTGASGSFNTGTERESKSLTAPVPPQEEEALDSFCASLTELHSRQQGDAKHFSAIKRALTAARALAEMLLKNSCSSERSMEQNKRPQWNARLQLLLPEVTSLLALEETPRGRSILLEIDGGGIFFSGLAQCSLPPSGVKVISFSLEKKGKSWSLITDDGTHENRVPLEGGDFSAIWTNTPDLSAKSPSLHGNSFAGSLSSILSGLDDMVKKQKEEEPALQAGPSVQVAALPCVCSSCGMALTEKHRFCPKCGARVEAPPPHSSPAPVKPQCVKCGRPYGDADKFCKACGEKRPAD